MKGLSSLFRAQNCAMKVFDHLAAVLLDPSENRGHFVEHCTELHRRIVRTPSYAHIEDRKRDVALAICVCAHLCGTSIDSAFQALKTMCPTSEADTCSREQLSRVCETDWKPSAVELGLDNSKKHGKGNPVRQLLDDYFIVFVPSILFSKARASLLLEQVRKSGGGGQVLSASEKGFREACALRGSCKRSYGKYVLCADLNLINKYSAFYELDSRPPKWLRDSLRDSRIKHPSLYRKPEEEQDYSPRKRKRLQKDPNNHQPKHSPSKQLRISKSSLEMRKSLISDGQCLVQPTQKEERVSSKLLSSISSTQLQKKLNVKETKNRPPSWACEIRTTFSGDDFPMNEKICELLGIVQEACLMKKDSFRAIGYQKAIAKIKALRHEIVTVDDVLAFSGEKGIGLKLERKLMEIVKTGRLLQAENVLENSESTAVKEICNVWGIGPVKALHLCALGIKSVSELQDAVKKDSSLLDRNQKIGLRHYEDLLLRIPRKHVAELEQFVRMVVKSVNQFLEITVAGSYLRGKADCGDVDILIRGTHEQLSRSFTKVINEMRRKGVLTDDLTIGEAKYFGIFRFPGRPHARVDLFAVPHEEYPFALLTYTGSAIFNRFVDVQMHEGSRRVG